jgi:hypothetical protein
MSDDDVKGVPQGVIADDAMWLLNNCLAGDDQAADQVSDLAGDTTQERNTEGKT